VDVQRVMMAGWGSEISGAEESPMAPPHVRTEFYFIVDDRHFPHRPEYYSAPRPHPQVPYNVSDEFMQPFQRGVDAVLVAPLATESCSIVEHLAPPSTTMQDIGSASTGAAHSKFLIAWDFTPLAFLHC